MTKVTNYTNDASIDLYYPSTCSAKFPVVFFVHNGGAKKEDWGDYPQELAAKGFVTASIGWSNFTGSDDIAGAINNVLNNYADKIDPSRAAFVGGCHGGVKLTWVINEQKVPFQPKTIVFLSVSEPITLPENHPPILGFYAVKDRLGDYYRNFTKKLVEDTITQPKKAVAIDGSPHGNEMVADEAFKQSVRNEITGWLTKYLVDAK